MKVKITIEETSSQNFIVDLPKEEKDNWSNIIREKYKNGELVVDNPNIIEPINFMIECDSEFKKDIEECNQEETIQTDWDSI